MPGRGKYSFSFRTMHVCDCPFHSMLCLNVTRDYVRFSKTLNILDEYQYMSLLAKLFYYTKIHGLRKVPGPWFPGASSLWIRWQRWNGNLSFSADELLSKYGPIVRISPKMVLLNDPQAVNAIFSQKDLDTMPKAIHAFYALEVTNGLSPICRLTHIACDHCQPVMIATMTKNLKYWAPIFESNISQMINDLADSDGLSSEDIVHHLRITTLRNSQVVMGGPEVNLKSQTFPSVVGEYNFLVVWRLCFPEWLFSWMKYSPFSKASFRIRSSDLLFQLGDDLRYQAEAAHHSADHDDAPTIYELLTKKNEKSGGIEWTRAGLSAEMAGQVLAATETTSSALTFIFYELAKRPDLIEEIYKELQTIDGTDGIESLQLLAACIKEGLRFRPPVALTGSRVVPKGGMTVLDYFIPEGTVITTQSLSLSRQSRTLFPDYDTFNPKRWLDQENLDARLQMIAPFGVGTRRCPGKNLASFQMRLLLAHTIRAFQISIPPETTPEVMAPFEANGFRSRYDKCFLLFKPRC
ncbi:hypothetical protein CROQUDRAFT_667281 [Cronartium quercuum f. sp. fusiforme G11]|uniref:Cytochrome P450 n=1 Tax=Cronartium quercuum f. sp. fusiforme G11 TaxID=708437 RepID=A0A9P6NYD3_9BASI|nr:hypothetical protein CROQUDRAFT_667281 [Cronartium quercuum f. sp. fusiforme G11]